MNTAKTISFLLLGITFVGSAQAVSPFKIFKGTGSVNHGRCHMHSCSWSKSISTRVVQFSEEQAILEVKLLGGTTSLGDNIKPPTAHEWNKKPHTVVITCSYDHPSTAVGSQLTELEFDEYGVPGVFESSARLYFKYCHSEDLMDISEAASKYGYLRR